MYKNGEKTAEYMREIGKNTQFSSHNQPLKNGRKKKLCNAIEEIPANAQMLVYGRLWQALKCNSKKEAMELLKEEAEGLGEYGFVLQVAIETLSGKNGWSALMDIFDRLFGKAPFIIATEEIKEDDYSPKIIRGFCLP